MTYVLDASVLALTFLEQEGSRAFTGWLRERFDEGDELLAPPLLSYELGNVIGRELDVEDPTEWREVHDDALRLVTLVDPPTSAVFDVAGELTYYDGTYLALARQEDGKVVTGDDALERRAEDLDMGTLAF